MPEPTDDPTAALIALRGEGELARWDALGRAVRPGTWAEQAVPTLDRIDRALAEQRLDDAAGLAAHLVVEAEEIHELYTAWSEEIPRILARAEVPRDELDREGARLVQATGALDPEHDWEEFGRRIDAFAQACRRGEPAPPALAGAVAAWAAGHDRHRDLVAGWIGVAVTRLGEAALGDVWRELQADGIAAYGRYDLAANPWPDSFTRLVQTAIEGMHGHLGGPLGRGEVELSEHEDRVELRFAPCGSGGKIRAAERFGVTTERHDWAWNETGVCHYCVHCCVLQQIEPIDRLGYPARVIDPPLRPGDACTWTVYRDPALVPEEAYRRVGRVKPEPPS